MKQKGFTLIDLMVIIFITANLAAVLYPMFSKAKNQASETTCISNLKQLGTAISQYCNDWGGRLPTFESLGSQDYLWATEIVPYMNHGSSTSWDARTGNMFGSSHNTSGKAGGLKYEPLKAVIVRQS
jgi:Tfp pilus assembly protein PilE